DGRREPDEAAGPGGGGRAARRLALLRREPLQHRCGLRHIRRPGAVLGRMAEQGRVRKPLSPEMRFAPLPHHYRSERPWLALLPSPPRGTLPPVRAPPRVGCPCVRR